MKHSYTNRVLPRVAKTVVSRLLCSGLGIAARFFSNLLHYVILHHETTLKTYLQNEMWTLRPSILFRSPTLHYSPD